MSTWTLLFHINGGEYISDIKIKAHKAELVGECVVVADGVSIEFDERISDLKKE